MALQQASGGAPGLVIADRYRLDQLSGDTLRTEVWEGWVLTLARPVMVKLIHAGDIPTAGGRLGLALVVDLFDVTRHEGMAVLVFERLECWPLNQLLQQRPVLQPDEVSSWMVGVAQIVESAHHCGIPHGAITTSNILVLADGSVRLTDFRGRQTGTGDGPFDTQPDLLALCFLLHDLLLHCSRSVVSNFLWSLADPDALPQPDSVLAFRLLLEHQPEGSSLTKRKWWWPVVASGLFVVGVTALSWLLIT